MLLKILAQLTHAAAHPRSSVLSPCVPCVQILSSWRFDEQYALDSLDRFIAQCLRSYEKDRGYADGRCVTRLSPYLHFGQLSPRVMVSAGVSLLFSACVAAYFIHNAHPERYRSPRRCA